MKLLTARSRMTFGLAGMLVSIVCTAMMLGMVPERRSAVLSGRAKLCEAIAVSSSDYVGHRELPRLEKLLQDIVKRNDELLSAGVREANGELMSHMGDHLQLWQAKTGEHSDDTHVQVPIRSGKDKWGSVELRFAALRPSGWTGLWSDPWVRLTVFVATAGYILFYIYLGKMLQHLDPSKTVPKRVRSALDSLAEGLLVIDGKQRIVLANQSFASWIGRPPERLIGVHAGKLNWRDASSGNSVASYPWVEAIRLETPQAGQMLGLPGSDDALRILIANASPVLGADGKYRGVLVSFDDVTQLENTKSDLDLARQAAEEANLAKSQFLARMSHEIRTPMNAILGYTDVLRRGFDESAENRQEYLNTIHGSGEHLLALINDILDLSKVESGQLELELSRCSPHKLIQQVAALLRSKANQKGIALQIQFDGPLPETVLTDAVRLRQAVMNLAGNAIKFTDHGSVTIAARLSPPSNGTPRPQLAISVIDTGIGIPAAAMERIFEPFAQADSSVTRRYGGTGLGLAISKQLAEAMQGGIAVRSAEGKGSIFTMTIDAGSLEGVPLIDADAALTPTSSTAAADQQVVQLPPARILVADDGPSNRKLLQLVLGRAGAETVLVENGQQAVEQALQQPFDVILMDMQMPVMDGYTAATTLRNAGYAAPILALTAHAMSGDEEKCRAAGCSGFLTKPINIDGLLASLLEVLSGRVAGQETVGQETVGQKTVGQKTVGQKIAGQADLPAAALAAEPQRQASSHGETSLRPQLTAEPNSTEVAPPARAADGPIRRPHDHEHADRGDADDAELAPLISNLPLDDADFREIVEEFTVRLAEKMAEMMEAWQADDFAALAQLAHWLKGSGGTAGYDAFTVPSRCLEQAARAADKPAALAALDELIRLAGRITIPALA